MNSRFEKIVVIENEIESLRLSSELTDRHIPFAMRSYHDTAYDGLFQFSAGWGHLEAPAAYRDEIMDILTIIRREMAQQTDEPENGHDRL